MFTKCKRFYYAFFLFLMTGFHVEASNAADYAPDDALTFLQLLDAGGIIMKVILLISVLMLGLGLFCFAWFRPRRYLPKDIKTMILNQIKGKRFREAFLICDGKQAPFCKVVSLGLRRVSLFTEEVGRDRTNSDSLEIFYLMESVRKMFEVSGSRLADRMRGLVHWFSHIGVLAPMLGLLGTVLGMIRAFGAIAYKVETGKPVLLSSAISQAMVTTAGGLVIGIFCMFLFYFLSVKVNRIIHDMEMASEEVADELEQALRKG